MTRYRSKLFDVTWFFIITASVIALDRLAKSIACIKLSQGRSMPVLPDIFHLTLVFNKGAAFGLMRDQRFFFIACSLVAVVSILIYIIRRQAVSAVILLSLGLIAGGAIGNLIDRVRYGYVIDLFDFRIWPVFNVADSCITVGAVVLCSYLLFGKQTVNDKIQI